MRVALNLVFLVPGETGGMEVYARELIARLAATDGLEVRCLVNRETAEAGDGPWTATMEVLPVRARNRVEWVRGEQQYVSRAAAAWGADLIHSLASTGPVRGPVPRVTTVHDLNYRTMPEAHFGLRALGMRLLVPAAARTSRRVFADSTATKADVVAHLRIDPGHVDVIPLGVHLPEPGTPVTPEAELRARLGLGDRPVALSVSAKRPHKNLMRLLEAFAAMSPAERPMLVIPGYPTPYERELRERAAILGVADDVAWPAWVDAADLEGLYALAACVVFPSLAEGFGLPVLEGMARGVPVATSNRSSMPEVAGDAALLFDPEDPAAIRAAVLRLIADQGLADRLRLAGRERAATFTWERTAELTVAGYRRALGPASA